MKPGRRDVEVRLDGKVFELSQRQVQIVEFIEQHGGRVATKKVYEWYPGGYSAISAMINKLRQKGVIETWQDKTTRVFEYRIAGRFTSAAINYHNPFNLGARA